MYEYFSKLIHQPEPFSVMTVRELWTRPHLARQMLRLHLDDETPLASRPFGEIKATASYLDTLLSLKGLRLCDLGCGPGLYADAFAELGASVTGVDFSKVSLDHARAHSVGDCNFLQADYVLDPLPEGFDIVTLIYTDYCSLPPEDRRALLQKIHQMLVPGGKLFFDVKILQAFADSRPGFVIEKGLMGGFWAGSDYIGIHQTWVYDGEDLALDRFTVIEPKNSWQIYNWCQFFSLDSITEELMTGGFQVLEVRSDPGDSRSNDDGKIMELLAVKS